ncbi:MAG: DUF423 domain-containing protein [Alphaproteobacteria bacterium]|nr:DUF423 domain-containing protein [Alphaproteobacteria bacterium]
MKICLILAALTGFLSVALGAAGDHMAAIVQQQHAFDTALRYNQLYSIFLTLLALYAIRLPTLTPLLRISCFIFTAGLLIFCGSLYALALTGVTALGYLTPVGGVMLMLGWILLSAYGCLPKAKQLAPL